MINRFKYKFVPPIILLLVCLIAYFPLSSFLFALKNDAYIYNFPNKFFFSEALHSGYIPIWNPYVNFGFPLYADPGFAWWNPITWIFGLIGYNAYTFTIELLTYIYIAGLGMYRLGRCLKLEYETSFAIAIMFLCSGFFVGNLQHINFLTAAAFIPWFTACWLNYQQFPTLKNLMFCGITFYLIFTSGHPAIPVASIYFVFLLTLSYIFYNKTKLSTKAYIINQFKLIGVILFFLIPIIISYIIVIPFYDRFEKFNELNNPQTGITFVSLISFFSPFTTIKNTSLFETDVSMRNFYISIPAIIFFIHFLFNNHKNNIQKIFLVTGICFFFFSASGLIKQLIYSNLPGFEYIRTNGEFRVFILFSFLICAAYPLNNFLLINKKYIQYFSKSMIWISCSLLATISILFFFLDFPIVFNLQKPFLEGIKYFIDNISFSQSLLIGLSVTLILSVFYYISTKKTTIVKSFMLILIIDLVINTCLLLPITGVGKTNTFEIQKIIQKSEKGFPEPVIEKPNQKTFIPKKEEEIIGDWGWYNKKLNLHYINYPSILKTTKAFFALSDSQYLLNKKFLFFNTHPENNIQTVIYKPHKINAKISVLTEDTLVLLQNYFPGWVIKINNEKVKPSIFNHTFISVPVQKGVQNIEMKFNLPFLPYLIIWGIILFSFLVYMLFENKIKVSSVM